MVRVTSDVVNLILEIDGLGVMPVAFDNIDRVSFGGDEVNRFYGGSELPVGSQLRGSSEYDGKTVWLHVDAGRADYAIMIALKGLKYDLLIFDVLDPADTVVFIEDGLRMYRRAWAEFSLSNVTDVPGWSNSEGYFEAILKLVEPAPLCLLEFVRFDTGFALADAQFVAWRICHGRSNRDIASVSEDNELLFTLHFLILIILDVLYRTESDFSGSDNIVAVIGDWLDRYAGDDCYESALEALLTAEHDPDLQLGWMTSDGPTKTSPAVYARANMLLGIRQSKRLMFVSMIRAFLASYSESANPAPKGSVVGETVDSLDTQHDSVIAFLGMDGIWN